jgi:hypothetical protein
MGGIMEASSGSSTPRPFGEIFGLWLKVFQMDEAFFAAEAPRASNGNTLLGLLIYAVAAVIFGFIQRAIGFRSLFMQRYFGNSPSYQIPICLPLIAIVVVPLFYYIGIGLLHLSAKIFGGKGSYTTLAYLVSLYFIPLSIVSSFLSLIPCLGALIVLAIAVYRIILAVRAIKVNYRLSTGQAVGAYFVPVVAVLIIVVLLSVVVIAILALMAPSIGGIFSNIIQNLGTPAP